MMLLRGRQMCPRWTNVLFLDEIDTFDVRRRGRDFGTRARLHHCVPIKIMISQDRGVGVRQMPVEGWWRDALRKLATTLCREVSVEAAAETRSEGGLFVTRRRSRRELLK